MSYALSEIHIKHPPYFESASLHPLDTPEVILDPSALNPERIELLNSLALLRLQKIYSKVLPLSADSKSLVDLAKTKDLLNDLVEPIKSSNLASINEKIECLPAEIKSLILWSVKTRSRLHPEQKAHDLVTLGIEAEPLIYTRGQSLLEQLIYFIEDQISVHRQRETSGTLRKLAEKPSPEMIRALFFTLPILIRNGIYDNIYHASKDRAEEEGWGQRVFEKNPLLIYQLNFPHSYSETILQHHLDKHQQRLFACEKAFELSFLEVASLQTALGIKNAKPLELEEWLSPTIKNWLRTLKSPKALSILSQGLPGYNFLGAHPILDGTFFRVQAPHAQHIDVVLTEKGIEIESFKMDKQEDGHWTCHIPKNLVGKTFIYRVKDCFGGVMTRIDPYSYSTYHCPENHEIHSVVVDQQAYIWKDQDWMAKRPTSPPLDKPLSIYELQIKSWLLEKGKSPSYRELAPKLATYCQENGYTHVELYGLAEHIQHLWHGYQPTSFFPPYHELGNLDDLKALIDKLHEKGIGVIYDFVPGHYQHFHDFPHHSSSFHAFDGVNRTGGKKTPWGTRYFDFTSEASIKMLLDAATYLLNLHIDGFRVDAVSPILKQPGGEAFLKKLNQTIQSNHPGALKIAEETDGFPNITKSLEEGGLGFDLKWNIYWNHISRNLLKTPHHERSNEEHHEGKVLTFLKACKAGEKTINTQSHDDSDCRSHECTLYQSASHAPDEESRFRDLRNYYSWQVLSPSHGYLIHMDMTQPESWYPRLEQGQCPVQWDLLNENKNHQGSSECLKDLNFLYREHAAFWKLGPQGYKPLYDSQDQAVVSYLRTDEKEDHLIIVHNFKNSGYSEYELPIHNLILKVSRVMEIFNSDRATYHGSGKFENKPIEIIIEENQTTRLRLALPPLSSLVLQIVS